ETRAAVAQTRAAAGPPAPPVRAAEAPDPARPPTSFPCGPPVPPPSVTQRSWATTTPRRRDCGYAKQLAWRAGSVRRAQRSCHESPLAPPATLLSRYLAASLPSLSPALRTLSPTLPDSPPPPAGRVCSPSRSASAASSRST